MYLSILFLPLCGSLLATNRKNGDKGGPILSIICMLLATFLATIAFWEVGLNGSTISIKQGYWIKSNYLNIEWSLLFDSQTVSMFIPVLYLSSLVQIYSLGYMDGDPHQSRFFSYLSLFTFFMLIQITGENLLVLFLGWEGVGLTSYLLINFWFTRIAANMAALKAFQMNRVGDWALSLGLLLTIALTADLSFATIFSLASYLNTDLILILAILLLIGASAKSAQFGLHSWLAHSMEGYKLDEFLMSLNIKEENMKEKEEIKGKENIKTPIFKEIKLEKFNWEACIGLIIGDGYCSKLLTSTSNSRMQFSFRDEWFVKWLLLTVFCYDGKNLTFCTGKIHKFISKRNYTHYFFQTRKLPIFKTLCLLFYDTNNKKILTSTALKDFSFISLAYLQMSDGYWSNNTIYICTENFDLESLKLLVAKLRSQGIICSYYKRYKGFRIRLSSRGLNIAHVRKQVLPYFHPSLIYKLGL